MAYYEDESQVHFKLFATNLEAAIKKYEALPEENRLHRQRRQLKELLSLENQLRTALIAHPWGPSVYRSFVELIVNEKRNILAARPYFRERQGVFAAQISKALKKRSDRGLYKFRINYSFILFAMSCHKWPAGGKIARLAKQINNIRMEIMELNLPLAISQARIFWANTPRSHLTFMDLVQIHCGGLMVAVDKFVPPDTRSMTETEELDAYRKFRAVAIGRMIGDRIEQYSETPIHYRPVDKRKIYRANKVRRLFKEGVDFEQIAVMVNAGVDDPAHHTTAEEIADLLASASCVSGDVSLDLDGETLLERYESNAESRPDLEAEEKEAILALRDGCRKLPLLERKWLKMKGIEHEENL